MKSIIVPCTQRGALFIALFVFLTVPRHLYAEIIDINARSSTPITLSLAPGVYIVTPIGTQNGGAYDSWNPWGSSSTCSNPEGCPTTSPTTVKGWVNRYAIESDAIFSASVNGTPLSPVTQPVPAPNVPRHYFLVTGSVTRIVVYDGKAYPTTIAAFEASTSSAFVLDKAADVDFRIIDSGHSDNQGGISLNVQALSPQVAPPLLSVAYTPSARGTDVHLVRLVFDETSSTWQAQTIGPMDLTGPPQHLRFHNGTLLAFLNGRLYEIDSSNGSTSSPSPPGLGVPVTEPGLGFLLGGEGLASHDGTLYLGYSNVKSDPSGISPKLGVLDPATGLVTNDITITGMDFDGLAGEGARLYATNTVPQTGYETHVFEVPNPPTDPLTELFTIPAGFVDFRHPIFSNGVLWGIQSDDQHIAGISLGAHAVVPQTMITSVDFPDALFTGLTLAPLCDGDANSDGAIDVNDISYVLFRLGDPCAAPGCDGDANGDGAIDVNDISFVLFRLGESCG